MKRCLIIQSSFFLCSILLFLGMFMPKIVEAQEMSKETTGEVRRGVFRPVEDSATFWGERYNERLMKQLEPSGKPSAAKIGQYLETYKHLAVYDPRTICFEVKGENVKGKIILTGMVSLQEEKDGLLQALNALKLKDVEDRIGVLPSTQLGDTRYAIAKVAHVPFFSAPTGRQERLTEGILGDRIFLLKEDDVNGYYFAQHSGGYLGWIRKQDVLRVSLNDFREWRSKKRALFRKSYEDASTKIFIPLGAELKLDALGNVTLPDGKTVSVPDYYFKSYEIEETSLASELLNSAREYLNTAYVWGGVTREGIDCSGFVQTLYRGYGVNLARDADQQFITGEIVGWRGFIDDLLPGDLLYFASGNGRIGHTAIYLGDQKFIQAQEPKVRYSSFRPGDPDYDFKTCSKFVFAKRVLRGE